MEAILHVSTPSNNLSSLQNYYDAMQNHNRALAALATPPETYGPMLYYVNYHLTSSLVWPNTLLDSILKEIRISEAGQHSGKFTVSQTSSLKTAGSFHTPRGPLILGSQTLYVHFARAHTKLVCVPLLPIPKNNLP